MKRYDIQGFYHDRSVLVDINNTLIMTITPEAIYLRNNYWLGHYVPQTTRNQIIVSREARRQDQ